MKLWEILLLVEVGGLLVLSEERSLRKKSIRIENSSKEEIKHSIERSPKKHQELVPLVYLFSTFVSDPSRGFLQSRSESRGNDGEVKGQYSYMDGFYKVKVLYTAGRSGFRVLREERIPLKNTNAKKNQTSVEKRKTYKNS